jgi:hypothetical protein
MAPAAGTTRSEPYRALTAPMSSTRSPTSPFLVIAEQSPHQSWLAAPIAGSPAARAAVVRERRPCDLGLRSAPWGAPLPKAQFADAEVKLPRLDPEPTWPRHHRRSNRTGKSTTVCGLPSPTGEAVCASAALPEVIAGGAIRRSARRRWDCRPTPAVRA